MTVHLIPNDWNDNFNQISIMLEQERHYMCEDYLRLKGNKTKETKSAVNSGGGASITAACRARMCRWLFHTASCAKFDPETASAAMTLLDRFASSNSNLRARRSWGSHGRYQLAALSCFFITIKTNEAIDITPATMSMFTGGCYNPADIISCEKEILASLQWKLNGPSPMQFIRCILDHLPESEKETVLSRLEDRSYQQVELALEDYACLILQRSTLAIAAVLNSLEDIPQDDFHIDKRSKYYQALSDAFGLDLSACPMIKAVRMRLLHKTKFKSFDGREPQEMKDC